MTTTKTDIAYGIGFLSRYNQESINQQKVLLKHEFWCLNGTMDCGLHFREDAEGARTCCVNSGYAGCPDNYQFTSGLVISFGGVVD